VFRRDAAAGAAAQRLVRPAQRVHLVVVTADREVLQHAQELLVPLAPDNLHVARLGLRAHRLGARLLVPGRRGELREDRCRYNLFETKDS
jgi:hypothetical protein